MTTRQKYGDYTHTYTFKSFNTDTDGNFTDLITVSIEKQGFVKTAKTKAVTPAFIQGLKDDVDSRIN